MATLFSRSCPIYGYISSEMKLNQRCTSRTITIIWYTRCKHQQDKPILNVWITRQKQCNRSITLKIRRNEERRRQRKKHTHKTETEKQRQCSDKRNAMQWNVTCKYEQVTPN